MSLELLGGRILAPWFGSSIYVWGSIITVFMLSLSVGYFIGGRLSLHSPSLAKFGCMFLAGGGHPGSGDLSGGTGDDLGVRADRRPPLRKFGGIACPLRRAHGGTRDDLALLGPAPGPAQGRIRQGCRHPVFRVDAGQRAGYAGDELLFRSLVRDGHHRRRPCRDTAAARRFGHRLPQASTGMRDTLGPSPPPSCLPARSPPARSPPTSRCCTGNSRSTTPSWSWPNRRRLCLKFSVRDRHPQPVLRRSTRSEANGVRLYAHDDGRVAGRSGTPNRAGGRSGRRHAADGPRRAVAGRPDRRRRDRPGGREGGPHLLRLPGEAIASASTSGTPGCSSSALCNRAGTTTWSFSTPTAATTFPSIS